jgi:hypothetical protein
VSFTFLFVISHCYRNATESITILWQYLINEIGVWEIYIQIFVIISTIFFSANTVVGIETGYGLHDREVGIRVPVGSRFFTSPIVQTGSGVHPASYTLGIRGPLPEVKRPGCEADHSPPTSAKVKKMWIYTSIPPYVFI